MLTSGVVEDKTYVRRIRILHSCWCGGMLALSLKQIH